MSTTDKKYPMSAAALAVGAGVGVWFMMGGQSGGAVDMTYVAGAAAVAGGGAYFAGIKLPMLDKE